MSLAHFLFGFAVAMFVASLGCAGVAFASPPRKKEDFILYSLGLLGTADAVLVFLLIYS